jgi:hypothetical protein
MLVSTAIARERQTENKRKRERAERRGGAKGKQITEPLEGYARIHCNRAERDRDREREREREREGGEERRSERETNYGTARRICDPRKQVRCFGPFDSDKAASPEFFLALGCWRRMRERELPRSQSFCLSSSFLYFASAATDPQTEKYLGCSKKIVAFATAYLFISFNTFSHSVPTIVGKDKIHFIPSP